ncbi:FtsQ-type POTRA domain-containing protein [Nocardioides sp. W7]|uniref:cell division protein FtsQ/DivIB n=1 Tax=Nocardioides sp. W7 TaxID=2931390 RepID=UPI001FD2F614|nr:FtsQ-type POTRA domain-containing protein [Nocardioides sp. W7]
MAERRPPDPVSAAERTRRRFARRQWRRRWLAWRYVAGIVVLLGLVGGSVYAVYFSTWLSVQGVEVAGTRTISEDVVRDAARVPEGEPLATVDLNAVRSRVESLADVRAADVTRQWPDQVLVRIEEREPVAVVEIGGQIRGMDDTGVLFRRYRSAPDDLPLVKAGPEADSETLQEAATVIAALPAGLVGEVARLEVDTVDEIRLVLRGDRQVMWGSADESELKAEVLGGLLRQEARWYDVSVPSRPATSNEPAGAAADR